MPQETELLTAELVYGRLERIEDKLDATLAAVAERLPRTEAAELEQRIRRLELRLAYVAGACVVSGTALGGALAKFLG